MRQSVIMLGTLKVEWKVLFSEKESSGQNVYLVTLGIKGSWSFCSNVPVPLSHFSPTTPNYSFPRVQHCKSL